MTKAEKLRKAVELLGEADCLIQEALGAGDVTYEYFTQLNNIMDDLEVDATEAENEPA